MLRNATSSMTSNNNKFGSGVQLKNITKQVGSETHLYDINLTFGPGLNVLFGQTRSGKTSLLRLMAGLDRPSGGRIIVDGQDVTTLSVQKRKVAMVYQQFVNYPSMTVYDNIASPLKLARLNKNEIDRRVREMAEMLHIVKLLERLPGEISGGQQQRTAIARALVKEADLLLLDEPLVNLDYKLREELRSEMREIFRRRSAIAVYATTDPVEALLLGGNAVVLDAGRVVQQGATVDVYRAPASARVAEVFSDPPMNLIEGIVDGDTVCLQGSLYLPLSGHLASLSPGAYKFGVRSGNLSIKRGAREDLEISAIVELTEVSGSDTFIHVTHNDVAWVIQEQGVHSVAVGLDIPIFLNTKFLYVFSADGRLVSTPETIRATPNSPGIKNNVPN